MSAYHADVTVHIDESLDQWRRDQLRRDLCDTVGVLGVRLGERTPHLMVVEFDPLLIRSPEILQRITCKGVHAELLGL